MVPFRRNYRVVGTKGEGCPPKGATSDRYVHGLASSSDPRQEAPRFLEEGKESRRGGTARFSRRFREGLQAQVLDGEKSSLAPLGQRQGRPWPYQGICEWRRGVGRWGGAVESCEGNFAVLLLVGHGRGRIWFCEFPLDVAFETSEKECPSIRKSFSSGTGKRTGTPQDRNLCFAPA